MKKTSYLAFCLALSTLNAAHATEWVTSVAGGSMTFDDWGYTGPDGRTATDFGPINGFGGLAEGNTLDENGGIGQIQTVKTVASDGLTPDDPYKVESEAGDIRFRDAIIDTQVNFYKWGYTTVAGSTFNNMQIDYDGDYLIERNDMAFEYYNTFEYTMDPDSTKSRWQVENDDGSLTTIEDGSYATNIHFQPYALSDATGWCGSVMSSNPASLEAMAGQVQFDFGFEAFLGRGSDPTPGVMGEGALQIVQNFQMRSYGSLNINVTLDDGTNLVYNADAVVNNTNPAAGSVNPDTGLKEVGGTGVDEDSYNEVSFMGGGVVPSSIFVRVTNMIGYDAVSESVDNQAYIDEVLDGSNITAIYDAQGNFVEAVDSITGEVLANVVLHKNAFGGYPFLLRADGVRILDAFDMSVYTDTSGIPASAYNANGELVNIEGTVVGDLSAVPVPAAVWLFGSGLIGLIGLARRKSA